MEAVDPKAKGEGEATAVCKASSCAEQRAFILSRCLTASFESFATEAIVESSSFTRVIKGMEF